MHVPALMLAFAMLASIVDGYPPRYSYHRGHLYKHSHHHKKHEHLRGLPVSAQLTNLNTRQNTTHGSLE